MLQQDIRPPSASLRPAGTGLLLSAAAAIALIAAPARAQDSAPVQAAPAEPADDDHLHHDDNPDIIVTAPYVGSLDLLAGTSVLTGAQLQRDVRPQIGDSLARLPGVSATSFTPGASRPVLRGFQGERIRVLTDGIGSIDVSNTSADHAVTIDPLTAERIEVLHGPAVLLFGGQAIGGAVNVIDRRIPRSVPEQGYHVDVLGSFGSAANERSIGGAIDVGLGVGLVAHADGSYRKTGDLSVGSYVLSPRLRDEQRAIAAEELAEGHDEEAAEALELAELKGKVPNSAVEQKSAGAGLAYIAGPLSIGGSVSWFASDYGVPSRPGAEHLHGDEEEAEEDGEEHGEEQVSIGLDQRRFDLRGEYQLADGPFETIKLRASAAKYDHTEFEGDEVGTIFKSKGYEGRLELAQRERGGWQGASGAQLSRRTFDSIGAEAFVPANVTRQFGLFTLQEIERGSVTFEAAARYDHSDVRSDVVDFDRSFGAISAAAGATLALRRNVRVGVNLSRTERAPSAEELLSDGPHVATQAFEQGNPQLGKEKSLGAEAYVRVDRPGYSLNATVFGNWFDDFIYQAATGAESDGLPVYRYFQRDARYLGFELEGSARLFEAGGYRFVGDVVADYVRATIKKGGPVPRIPPMRILGGIEAQSDRIDGRVELEWVADQKRVAEFETPTDGHLMTNASIAWRPWGRSRETLVTLSANNIFDVDARRHASFTKDFVPMAGRDIRLGLRMSFE